MFSVHDLRKMGPSLYRPQLSQWQEKGYIKKVRRGYYVFSDLELNESMLCLIANRIYAPSYVSFETALSHYGLIPEGVYTVTSATTKKTSRFATPIAQFHYHTVKPQLFFGYQLEEWRGQQYKIADIEKTVLDYLYLHPTISQEADFHEWRFNSKVFLESADCKKFQRYAELFHNTRFSARAEILLGLIQRNQ